jgi:crotonobetainyl-CoA:carnitine CoA-transferase CaiB-like acyl-CoA transferase
VAEDALSDVVVLELATGVAGPYCGKLLADLGAQVIKVEPPGGDPVRGEPPLVGGASVFFNWLNANKLGVTADSSEQIDSLGRYADVIIHDQRGAQADALDARLAAVNPRAVVLSLTPYGRSGERSGWQATPFTEMGDRGLLLLCWRPGS